MKRAALTALVWAAACTQPNPEYITAGMRAPIDAGGTEARAETARASDAAEVGPRDDGSAPAAQPDAPEPVDAPVDVPPDAPAANDSTPDLLAQTADSADAVDASMPDLAPPAATLVSRWKLDEGRGAVANDEIGGNHATLVNMPVWGNDALATRGRTGRSLIFDGTNDHADVMIIRRTLPAVREAKTVTLWFNSADTRAGMHNMLALFDPVAQAGVQIGFAAGTLAVWEFTRNTPFLTVAQTFAPMTWYHLAYTFDGTTHRLYVNGILRSESTQPLTAGPITVVRFATYSAPDEMYQGSLDDVRIYQGALGAPALQALQTDIR